MSPEKDTTVQPTFVSYCFTEIYVVPPAFSTCFEVYSSQTDLERLDGVFVFFKE